jgi:hypothetical protein
MADAVAHAPIETGRLRESARLEPAEPEHLHARVEFTAPYAADVEFGLPRDEPARYDPPGGPHYLQNSALAEVPHLPNRLARELRKTF